MRTRCPQYSREMIELSKQTPELGLLRILVLYAHGGEPVQDAELLFAKALVDNE